MRTAAELITALRNRLARSLATRPMPEITSAVIATPLRSRAEVDEAAVAIGAMIGQTADYYARLRAEEVMSEHNMQALMLAALRTEEGRTMLAQVITENHGVNVHLTSIAAKAKPRPTRTILEHHHHSPRPFSWIGALVGSLLGMVIGYLLNVYVFVTNPIRGDVGGRQFVVGEIFDTWYGNTFIFVASAIFFGALFGALFHTNKNTQCQHPAHDENADTDRDATNDDLFV